MPGVWDYLAGGAMRIIWDATNERMYPIAGKGFTSGTVVMVRRIAAGLAERGHAVHVITADLEEEEQRGERLWYWPADYHPTKADVAVQLMHVNPDAGYDADILLLATTGVNPGLGPGHAWAAQVDGFPVLSAHHGEILRRFRPTVPAEKVFVTGLGVDLNDFDLTMNDGGYEPAIHGRMLYANDPSRGLLAALEIFERVREAVPNATFHVAYDFDGNLERVKWQHSLLAQQLWECKRRMETTPGVVNLGALSREEIVREQRACQVHCMPADPLNYDQLHGLTQLECAAAGSALVLSDAGAFPEVFGDGATILPVVGRYVPERARRASVEDYAAVVVDLMRDAERWRAASAAARALAERQTWTRVVDAWEAMLARLSGGEL